MSVKRLLSVDDDRRVCRMIECIAARSSLEVFARDRLGRFETTYEYFQPDAILLDLCSGVRHG